MRVAYFVHDLGDAAVAKRIRMLRAAGAEVVLLGFRRMAAPICQVEGIEALDLGQTQDARLVHRAFMVARQLAGHRAWRSRLDGADVFLARNLEMLILASAARAGGGRGARLAYECLDIHRSMIAAGPLGAAMRAIERHLLRRTDSLIVSSSAFVSNYFAPLQGIAALPGLSTHLVENKVFLCGAPAPRRKPRMPGPVWRIGWFGAIRCRRSLDMLSDLAARRPDLVEVVIRGKPSLTEFDDFHGQVSRCSGLSFHGPYRAADLDRAYQGVHFNWAIDYFEAGGNSQWLLPNRLYEGGRSGAVPLALASVATGAWLRENGLGVLLRDPATELEPFLEKLSAPGFQALERAALRAPANVFVADRDDCLRLARALEGAAP